MTTMNTIVGEFTVERAKKLKQAWLDCLANTTLTEFTFEGETFGVDFARYLLDHLEPLLKIN